MNRTLWSSCIEIFVTLIQLGLFYYYIFHRLSIKKNPPFRWQFYPLLPFVLINFLNCFSISPRRTLFLALFFELTFTFLWMEGSTKEKLLWGCLYRIIDLISDSGVFLFFNLISDSQDAFFLINNYPLRHIFSCAYLLVLFSLTIMISHMHWERFSLPLWLLPLSFLMVILGITAVDFLINVILDLNHSGNFPQNEPLYGAILVFLIICIFLLGLIVYVNHIYQKNIHLMENQQIYKLEHQQLELVSTTSQALRIWKHDFHHHLATIGSLLGSGRTEEALTYIQHINTSFSALSFGIFTGNQMVDAILSAKLLPIQQAGISFTHTLYLPEKLPLDDISTTSLLGNLLDNATAACLAIPEKEKRYINLSIKPFHDSVTIRLENSSLGQYRYTDKNVLRSTKDGQHHGIGLTRIREISENAGGFCEILPETDKFTITIVLPLPYTDTEETERLPETCTPDSTHVS